jgi:heme exporter protein A
MLEAINVGCVRGDRRLFQNLSFAIEPGGLVEVHGPNGSGKTSLLRILCGLAVPAEGEIRWHGQSIRSFREDYSAEIAYLGHQDGIKHELNSIENLRICSGLAGRALTKQDAAKMLERVGINSQHLPAHLLSAGQRRRVALARLVAADATVWILDEVMASLDSAAVELARNFISGHLNDGGMAIVATHQELNLPVPQTNRIDLRP